MGLKLEITRSENFKIRKSIADRRARIAAVEVDRSRLQELPAYFYRELSPQMKSREALFEGIREEVTLVEKMEAWRILFGPPRRGFKHWLKSLTSHRWLKFSNSIDR